MTAHKKLNHSEVIIAVKELAGGKLNNQEDLSRLILLAIEHDKLELLEELAFQARFSLGLIKIIQKRDSNINAEYFEKVKKEYTECIIKIRSAIASLTENSDNFIKEIYAEKFLAMTQLSLSNLHKLTEDLSYLKLYLNDLKRPDDRK